MLDYIMSKDVKAYLEKIGHKFTDFEIAGLVYNTANPRPVIHDSLRELLAQTDDDRLKTQINERLDYDLQMLEKMTCNEVGCIYEIKKPDEDTWGGYSDQAEAICDSFTTALEYGIKFLKSKFIITKRLLITNSDHTEDDLMPDSGRIECDENGSYIDWGYSGIESPLSSPYSNTTRFEDAFVAIPYPFRTGEIVKCIDTRFVNNLSGKFIGCDSDSDMWNHLEILKNRGSDNTDMLVCFSTIDEYGEEDYCDGIDPRNLEYLKEV